MLNFYLMQLILSVNLKPINSIELTPYPLRAMDCNVGRPPDLHGHHLQTGRAGAVQGCCWIPFWQKIWQAYTMYSQIRLMVPHRD